MKKLHYSTIIQASRKVVWDTMFSPDTYRQWTSGFCEGSYYEGSWEKGSRIKFLSPSRVGMRAEIAEDVRLCACMFQYVLMPLLMLSGLIMWKGHILHRIYGSKDV